MTRTAPTSDDVEALFQEGFQHAQTGGLGQAEVLLRDALARTRGTGTSAESRACGNLASLFAMTGRHFEALALYRRGLRIDEALDTPRRAIRHLANIASTFAMLEIHEATAATLEDLDARVATASDEDRREAEELTMWPRFYAAIHDRDAPLARRIHDRMAEVFRDRPGSTTGVSREVAECDLLCLEGRAEEALAVVAELRASGENEEEDEIHLAARRLDCLVLLRRQEEHAALTRKTAKRIEALGKDRPISDFSIDLASEVADHLARYAEHVTDARQVYDLAGTLVLRRIRELAERWDELPELAATGTEDTPYLHLLRDTYQAWQQRLMEAVVTTIRRHRSSLGAVLFAEDDAASILRICAWCSRLHTRSGHWLPVGHYVPDAKDIWVSHVMCPECVEKQRV